MVKPRRLFVDGPYGQIHVRMAQPQNPTQRPIVCTHMFPQSGRNFERFLEVASDDRIVIAPDFPGHGESDAPDSPISAEAYASSIWVAVDKLALLDSHRQVDLFGVHAGAKLAVEIAYQRPADVHRIVLSSAAVMFPEEVAKLKASFKTVPLDESGTRVAHLWNMVVKNRPDYMTLEMCSTAFSEILRGGEKYEWGHHAVFDYNLKFPDVLRSLPHPVALLNPKDELYEMTLRSLDYLQNATLFDLPNWGHGFLDAHTETVNEIVRAWFDADAVSLRTRQASEGPGSETLATELGQSD